MRWGFTSIEILLACHILCMGLAIPLTWKQPAGWSHVAADTWSRVHGRAFEIAKECEQWMTYPMHVITERGPIQPHIKCWLYGARQLATVIFFALSRITAWRFWLSLSCLPAPSPSVSACTDQCRNSCMRIYWHGNYLPLCVSQRWFLAVAGWLDGESSHTAYWAFRSLEIS